MTADKETKVTIPEVSISRHVRPQRMEPVCRRKIRLVDASRKLKSLSAQFAEEL